MGFSQTSDDEKMGFNGNWVNRVMMCVGIVTYRVKINGNMSKLIVPGCGIRQGDPISPYLFIICQEWFSCNLVKLQMEQKLLGVKIARQAPIINHLLFADDCVIFAQAELRGLGFLKELLKRYEKLAGQRINYEKSEIIGSKNVDEIMLHLYGNFLTMKTVDMFQKYLGMPIMLKKKKGELFKWLE